MKTSAPIASRFLSNFLRRVAWRREVCFQSVSHPIIATVFARHFSEKRSSSSITENSYRELQPAPFQVDIRDVLMRCRDIIHPNPRPHRPSTKGCSWEEATETVLQIAAQAGDAEVAYTALEVACFWLRVELTCRLIELAKALKAGNVALTAHHGSQLLACWKRCNDVEAFEPLLNALLKELLPTSNKEDEQRESAHPILSFAGQDTVFLNS